MDTVIIIGHGTSLATAMNAEFLFSRAAGAAARAVPAYQSAVRAGLSQAAGADPCSGHQLQRKYRERCKGLEAARQAGALAMGITGRGETKMREISDYLIEADTAVEQEAGMTAYSASHLFLLYSALRAAVLLGEKRGNAKGLKYWEAQWKSVKNAMSALPELFEKMGGLAEEYSQEEMHNVVALGTGPNLGTAQEGALKICEFAWVSERARSWRILPTGRSGRRTGKSPLLLLAPHENLQEKVLDLLAGCEIARTPTVIFTQKALPEVQKIGGPGHFDAGSRGGVPDAVSLCVSSMVFGIPFPQPAGKAGRRAAFRLEGHRYQLSGLSEPPSKLRTGGRIKKGILPRKAKESFVWHAAFSK